jgi:hypothetical protein
MSHMNPDAGPKRLVSPSWPEPEGETTWAQWAMCHPDAGAHLPRHRGLGPAHPHPGAVAHKPKELEHAGRIADGIPAHLD